jgi:hypothetical protein
MSKGGSFLRRKSPGTDVLIKKNFLPKNWRFRSRILLSFAKIGS